MFSETSLSGGVGGEHGAGEDDGDGDVVQEVGQHLKFKSITLMCVVYARRWPDPDPRWFGFHEIFHTCTVAAWACQCTACYLAVLG